MLALPFSDFPHCSAGPHSWDSGRGAQVEGILVVQQQWQRQWQRREGMRQMASKSKKSGKDKAPKVAMPKDTTSEDTTPKMKEKDYQERRARGPAGVGEGIRREGVHRLRGP
jgi:hypothetical protein